MEDWLSICWLGWENQEAQSQGVMITVVRSLAATPLQANWLWPTILKISVMVTQSVEIYLLFHLEKLFHGQLMENWKHPLYIRNFLRYKNYFSQVVKDNYLPFLNSRLAGFLFKYYSNGRLDTNIVLVLGSPGRQQHTSGAETMKTWANAGLVGMERWAMMERYST